MINTRTFNYTFSSAQGDFTTSGSNAECIFTMNALPEKDYFVKCTSFMIDPSGLGGSAPEFLSLVATNLSMDRGFCTNLGSNQTLLASCLTNQNAGTALLSGEGSVFRMTNCDMQRTFKCSIHGMELELLTDTDFPDDNYYVFTLQFTLVDEPF